MLKQIITVAGAVGTLAAAAPAFADWYQPVPPPVYTSPAVPVYNTPVPPVYTSPGYYYYGNDWRAQEAWRRHEAWERYRRWRAHEWRHHHHYRGW